MPHPSMTSFFKPIDNDEYHLQVEKQIEKQNIVNVVGGAGKTVSRSVQFTVEEKKQR